MTETFASWLNARLGQAGMTKSDLARQMFGSKPDGGAMSRDLVGTWANGQRLPSRANLKLVARTLGRPVEELAALPLTAPEPPPEPADIRPLLMVQQAMHHAASLEILRQVKALADRREGRIK